MYALFVFSVGCWWCVSDHLLYRWQLAYEFHYQYIMFNMVLVGNLILFYQSLDLRRSTTEEIHASNGEVRIYSSSSTDKKSRWKIPVSRFCWWKSCCSERMPTLSAQSCFAGSSPSLPLEWSWLAIHAWFVYSWSYSNLSLFLSVDIAILKQHDLFFTWRLFLHRPGLRII